MALCSRQLSSYVAIQYRPIYITVAFAYVKKTMLMRFKTCILILRSSNVYIKHTLFNITYWMLECIVNPYGLSPFGAFSFLLFDPLSESDFSSLSLFFPFSPSGTMHNGSVRTAQACTRQAVGSLAWTSQLAVGEFSIRSLTDIVFTSSQHGEGFFESFGGGFPSLPFFCSFGHRPSLLSRPSFV